MRTDVGQIMRQATGLLLTTICWSAMAGAQDLHRATVWDLKLGRPATSQPSPDEFRAFACGADGGPPRRPLRGWSDFARCPAEPNGWHEVYFEYDDEYEYVARARELPREVARWAGTTEAGFPVVVSALFDDGGMLRAVRVITDSRPDYRNDTTDAELKRRADAHLFGGVMAARYGVEPARDCNALPASAGESAVGSQFIKLACERTDQARGITVVLRTSYYRKPGQSGVNPQLSTQLTQGQFESSARLEIRSTP
jgi:hypothetical protein